MERKVKYKYKMFLFGSISILFLFGIAGCQKRDSQQEEQKSPNQAETKVEQENQAQSESLEEELEKIFLEEVYGTKEFYVESEEIARKILKLQGEALRKDLEENSQVREIESYLENTYGIEAVNLQNMDLELAQSVQTACDYMYGKYPILQKYLTNITVQEQINKDCTYEEFCLEISSYGQGLQEDGGTSYEETVAEAMADVYIHEEQCSDASRVIVDVINSRIAEKGM